MVKGKKGLLSKTTKPIVRRDATAAEEHIRALEKEVARLKRALKGTVKKKPAKRIKLKSRERSEDVPHGRCGVHRCGFNYGGDVNGRTSG